MLPKDAPKLEELLVQSESLPWREKSLKAFPKKCSGATKKRARQFALIKFAQAPEFRSLISMPRPVSCSALKQV